MGCASPSRFRPNERWVRLRLLRVIGSAVSALRRSGAYDQPSLNRLRGVRGEGHDRGRDHVTLDGALDA